MPSSYFDKKFVTTAVIIAVIYACIVIFINKIIGKEAAGVAGVALTALSTGIFKQFEGLRFQNTTEITSTISLKFNWWQVIFIAFLVSGISKLFVDHMDVIVPMIFHPTERGSDIGIMNGKLINNYSVWELSTKCLSFFIAGVIATRAFKRISYSVIIIGALSAIILDFYTEALFPVLTTDFTKYDISGTKFDQLKPYFEDYIYSFLWVVFSLIGSYLTQSKKQVI